MFKIFQNILVYSITVSIILGTFGLEIFKHVCTSHSLNKISMIESPKCEMDFQSEIIDHCCVLEEEIVVESNCCESEKIILNSNVKAYANTEECCLSFSDLNKIEEFLFPPIENKVIIKLTEYYFIDDTIIPDKSLEQIKIIQNHSPPLILSGRDILNSIHQLKLDTPVC